MRYAALFLICSVLESSAQDYIHDWLVLGAFHNPDRATLLSTDYLSGEERIEPVLAAPCANEFWVHGHHDGPALDLRQTTLAFAQPENAVAYVATWVYSARQQPARFLCGSDDGLSVWLNGVRVLQRERFGSLTVDSDTARLTLQQGWNKLLLKVSNGSGQWQVCGRFMDAEEIVVNHHPDHLAAGADAAPFVVYRFKISDGFLLDDHDSAMAAMELLLVAKRQTAPTTVSIAGSDEQTASPLLVPARTAGSLVKLEVRIPLELLCSQRRAFTLRLRESESETEIFAPAPLAIELLKNWFQPWRWEGWHQNKGSFTRTWLGLKMINGCQAHVMVDIGEAWGHVRADGVVLKPRFSRDSGDLLFDQGGNQTHRLEIGIDEGTARLVASKLVLHHRAIEAYLHSKEFYRSTSGSRQILEQKIDEPLWQALCNGRADQAEEILTEAKPLIEEAGKRLQNYRVDLLGNAHIDLMWLWRYPETIEVIKNTFNSALRLMEKYPDFKFAHGQAQSYVWMEEREPQLFAKIQDRVREGRWEILGGTWSQPDNNMPSGESLVRQYLYGKNYFREKFGVDVAVGFMPDTFGHPASLPQILKKCGIRDYIFFRPFEGEKLFYWQAMDGSTVLAYRPPDWYNSDITPEIGQLPLVTEKNFNVNASLRCYGVGDHGGGPTERDVQLARQLDATIGYPRITFSNSRDYFDRIRPQTAALDTVADELNFVFEGCWTSQAMTKKYNRKLEALLPAAETFSVFAQQFGARYPQQELAKAWQCLLLNQFHDIFDGSGIAAIYPDVRKIYGQSDSLGQVVLQRSLHTLAQQASGQPPQAGLESLLLFNHLNYSRREPITLPPNPAWSNGARFYDQQGVELAATVENDGSVALLTPETPAFGYTTIYFRTAALKKSPPSQRNLILQNRFLRVEVDYKTGHVVSIYDRRLTRELLRGRGNLLQLQADDNVKMTAWYIKLKGEPITLNQPIATRIIEANALRKIMRVVYQSGPSRFEQDIILYNDLARVDFCLRVDWQHRDTMLKVAFPFNVQGQARFDIPFGQIVREQTGQEVVAQKWVDISNDQYGLALLNDCKYGFDVKAGVVRMSALRAPHDPDSTADKGRHEMRYALYSHDGDWRQGRVVAAANSFNAPIWPVATELPASGLGPSHSFLTVDGKDILVSACKKAEKDDAVILRMQEISGQRSPVVVDFSNRRYMVEVDMMEEKIRELPIGAGPQTMQLLPYEVRTVAVYD